MAKPGGGRKRPFVPSANAAEAADKIRDVADELLAVEKNATLIQRIEARMFDLGLNPFSAAKRAGLGADYVRDIVRGKVKNPSAERLAKLATALQVSLPYLMGQEEKRSAYYEPPADAPDRQPPEPLAPWSPEQGKPFPQLLPVRHELMQQAFRPAYEMGRELGFHAAGWVTDPAFIHRDQWLEVVRDGSADLIAPEGSLLHVAKYDEEEKASLVEGDVVIVERHLVAPNSEYYLIERTVRIIHERYPQHGLWFYEYAADNEDFWGISDDIFRDDRSSEKGETTEEDIRRMAEIAADIATTHRKAKGEDPSVITIAEMVDGLRQSVRLRPRLVGKVLRAIIPLDHRAQFGLRVGASSGRTPK